jgi:hypothetical protein
MVGSLCGDIIFVTGALTGPLMFEQVLMKQECFL